MIEILILKASQALDLISQTSKESLKKHTGLIWKRSSIERKYIYERKINTA